MDDEASLSPLELSALELLPLTLEETVQAMREDFTRAHEAADRCDKAMARLRLVTPRYKRMMRHRCDRAAA